MRRLLPALVVALPVTLATGLAAAGPETALREFASGQIKKGVRTIGMGGDGATTGNYALVYQDHGGALVDAGIARFSDTANVFTFTAVGFTTPTFWDDAAFYVIALSQHATDLRVWDFTPASSLKPPSLADGSNSAVFVKFAKPLSRTWSIGFLGSYEASQMTLLPDSGAPPIRYETSWLPSGGFGVHWHPCDCFQMGARVIMNHDQETRDDATGLHQGLFRSYEYRLGAAWSPWRGTLIDVGAVALDRYSGVDERLGLPSTTFAVYPNFGVEQALVAKRVWARAGIDETDFDKATWTTGMSFKASPFKIDLAYLYGIAALRVGDQFGKRSASLIATVNFDYESLLRPR